MKLNQAVLEMFKNWPILLAMECLGQKPVSVFSKIFEWLLRKQISEYISQLLCPFLCGYRKVFGTQTTLFRLTEKWKYQLDKNGFPSVILMDLSDPFDTINYDLLIAKLHAYGFGKKYFRFTLQLLEK